MTDQSQDNHWDELVTDLGAEPRADAVQQPAADVPESTPESTPETPPEFDAVPSQTAMSQASAPGWDDLASDFGISPPPVQSRKTEPELAPVETEAETPVAEPQPAAADERRESTATSRSADRTDQPSRSDRPRRRRGRRDRSAEDSSVTQPENFSVDVEHIEAAVDFEIAEELEFAEEIVDVEEVAAENDEADEKSERPRRRRRRRGRRGVRRPDDGETEQGGADSAAEKPSDDESDDDDDDEDDLDDSDRPSGRSSAGKKTTHRNIPTWEEAVGVVVAANTEARSRAAKNAGRTRGRGRGGRGRGRPTRRDSNDQK